MGRRRSKCSRWPSGARSDLGGCIVHSNAPAWKCLRCGERHGTNEWLESLKRFERTPEEAAAQQADYTRRKAEKKERQRVLKARLRDPRRRDVDSGALRRGDDATGAGRTVEREVNRSGRRERVLRYHGELPFWYRSPSGT
jgi:hypothetical protein